MNKHEKHEHHEKHEKQEQAASAEQKTEFAIQRIYTKDLSFEAPNTPQIFQTEWAPQVDINLKSDTQKLTADVGEVVLKITVTVKLKDKTAFLIEVHQAGIFTLKGFSEEQLHPLLGSFCLSIIFPYAREVISETIIRGGFPPLYLAPINFDAYYQENVAKEKQEQK
jgi:preprotein translocase subunit SecB